MRHRSFADDAIPMYLLGAILAGIGCLSALLAEQASLGEILLQGAISLVGWVVVASVLVVCGRITARGITFLLFLVIGIRIQIWGMPDIPEEYNSPI